MKRATFIVTILMAFAIFASACAPAAQPAAEATATIAPALPTEAPLATSTVAAEATAAPTATAVAARLRQLPGRPGPAQSPLRISKEKILPSIRPRSV